MKNSLAGVNEILMDVYSDILTVEAKTLKKSRFKDISVAELHTVDAIGMYIPKTMGQVAKKLDITVGTLTVAVTNLEKKGYVQRVRSNEDRRVVKVSLTKKGRLLYRAYVKFHSDILKEIIVELSEQEISVLKTALISLDSLLLKKI